MKGPDLDTLCRKTVANKRREKILKLGKKKDKLPTNLTVYYQFNNQLFELAVTLKEFNGKTPPKG